jgi:hypothetical protein
MANHESSTEATSNATPSIEPFHKPYSSLRGSARHDPSARFAETVMDISRGAAVIADILHSHMEDVSAIESGSTNVRPLLGDNEMEALSRLAVVSLGTLAEMASARVDAFNKQSTKGA